MKGSGIEVVVLAAADLARPHEAGGFEHGEVLTHRLSREVEAVRHGEPHAEREERLPVLGAQFVEQEPSDRSGERFVEVGHTP